MGGYPLFSITKELGSVRMIKTHMFHTTTDHPCYTATSLGMITNVEEQKSASRTCYSTGIEVRRSAERKNCSRKRTRHQPVYPLLRQ